MYSQIFLKGNPTDWAPLLREFIVGRFELLRRTIPDDLLPNLLLDPAMFAIVVYVQLGFLLLAYLFRGNMRDLRVQLLNLEARYESSLREQATPFAELTGDGKKRQEAPETTVQNLSPLTPTAKQEGVRFGAARDFLTAHHEPESQPRAGGLPAASKKRKVAELAAQGAGALLIADSLHLRPAEVELLLRIHRLEQNSGDRPTV